MSISTLDGVIAGIQPIRPYAKVATPTLVVGRPHSLWYLNGNPGAGLTPANTAGGVSLSSSATPVNGQIRHVDPGSGNSYLAKFLANCTQPGELLLCDRLMQVGGNSGGTAISVTTTTAQTINTGTLPSRDDAQSANGAGVDWALEVITATGAGAATPTLSSYTNSAGTAAHSASLIDTYVASSAIGAFYRFGRQAGDLGVQSVQTLTLNTSMTSGSIALVAYRVLASVPITVANTPGALDVLTGAMQRLANGVVPFLVFIPSATTAAVISGDYTETQG